MIRFYCEVCGDHQEVEIEPLTKDNLNPDPWGDIVCKACHFVIATVSAGSEGCLILVEVSREKKLRECITIRKSDKNLDGC